MKKLTLSLLTVFVSLAVFSATPNATYFAGGFVGSKSFQLVHKDSDEKYNFQSRIIGFHGGFRGDYTQIQFEYVLDTLFEEKNVETKLGELNLKVLYFKSADLLYFLIGPQVTSVQGSTDLGNKDIPSGPLFGLNLGAGAFLGKKISVDWNYVYLLPSDNSNVELKENKTFSINVSYHF